MRCFIQRKSLFKDKEETLKFNIPINNLFHFISFFFIYRQIYQTPIINILFIIYQCHICKTSRLAQKLKQFHYWYTLDIVNTMSIIGTRYCRPNINLC